MLESILFLLHETITYLIFPYAYSLKWSRIIIILYNFKQWILLTQTEDCVSFELRWLNINLFIVETNIPSDWTVTGD